MSGVNLARRAGAGCEGAAARRRAPRRFSPAKADELLATAREIRDLLAARAVVDLDALLDKAGLARVLGLSPDWVEKHWRGLPGRFCPDAANPSAQSERIHLRSYLHRVGGGRLVLPPSATAGAGRED